MKTDYQKRFIPCATVQNVDFIHNGKTYKISHGGLTNDGRLHFSKSVYGTDGYYLTGESEYFFLFPAQWEKALEALDADPESKIIFYS